MGFHINMTGRGIMASDSHTHVRGSAFVGNETSEPQDLLEYFDKVEWEDEFRSSVISLNGYVAVVCQRDSKMFAAVDRARSIPLFYGCVNNELYISDDASWVQEKVSSLERSELAEHEFCMTGYVTGSDTLSPDVKQLRTGELLLAESGCESLRFDVERYYDFMNTEGYYACDAEELSKEFDSVLTRSFERLIALAKARTIAIPLSGGIHGL